MARDLSNTNATMTPYRANAPKRIVVCGNSTSAWMSCAFLTARYKNTETEIVLVTQNEPEPTPGAISVLPKFGEFLGLLARSEREFMSSTAATFKLASIYSGWQAPEHHHFQTFGEYGAPLSLVSFADIYRALLGKSDGAAPAYHEFSLAARLAKMDRFNHPSANPKSAYSTLAYAWHFDEALFASWLKSICEANVEVYDSSVAQVTMDNRDAIASVAIGEREIKADFYIDCSNARTLMSAFEAPDGRATTDWARALESDLNCKAIVRTPPKNYSCDIVNAVPPGMEFIQPDAEKLTFTLYTHSRDFDQAQHNTLTSTFGKDNIDVYEKANFRVNNCWQGNCVAIGPAAVQVNSPVVSSADLTWLGLAPLVTLAPVTNAPLPLAKEYNRLVGLHYDRVKDYAQLLKDLAAKRPGNFWRPITETSLRSEEMTQKRALYSRRGVWPSNETGAFNASDHLALMLGLKHNSKYANRLAEQIPPEQLMQHAKKIFQALDQAVAPAQDHRTYLRQYLQ